MKHNKGEIREALKENIDIDDIDFDEIFKNFDIDIDDIHIDLKDLTEI